MPEFRDPPLILLWQSSVENLCETPDREIEDFYSRLRQLIDIFDTLVRFDFAAKIAEAIGQRLGNCPGSSARHWPAHGVSGCAENKPKRRRGHRTEGEK